MTVTALASLTIASMIPVSDVDRGNTCLDTGWLKAFCFLFLTSGIRTRIWTKLLNCSVWDEVLFVSKNDE